jgi:hypothetical protein
MGELLSLIDAWGAENGVVFHEPLNSAEQRAGESA